MRQRWRLPLGVDGIGAGSDASELQRIRRALDAYFAAVNALDADAFAQAFADSGLTFDAFTSSPIEGRDDLRGYFEALHTGLSTRDEIQDAVFFGPEGAAVKWTGNGVMPDGRIVVSEGIHVFEINDEGLIQTLWTYRRTLPPELPTGS